MANGEHDEKTVELGVSPDGFSRTWKEETKEPMFSYRQFSDVVVFSLLDLRRKNEEAVSFHAAKKIGVTCAKDAGTETMIPELPIKNCKLKHQRREREANKAKTVYRVYRSSNLTRIGLTEKSQNHGPC